MLAECDSFNTAADKLGISQQALSKSMAQLEKSLGKTLILRKEKQGERLSEAGKTFLKHSHSVLHSMNELESVFQNAKSSSLEPSITRLRIGLMFFADNEVRQTLQKWEDKANLETTVALFYSQARLEQAILNQEIDFAISSSPSSLSSLKSTRVKTSDFVILGSKEWQGVDWNELTYLGFSDDPRQGDYFNIWPEDKYPRKLIGRFDAIMAVQLCFQNTGCLHIPDGIVSPYDVTGTALTNLVILAPPPFAATYKRYLIFTSHDKSKAAANFIDDLLHAFEKN